MARLGRATRWLPHVRIAILHNRDHQLLEEDPGREAREDVVRVAAALQSALSGGRREVELVPVDGDVLGLGRALEAARADVVVNLCESLAADSRGEIGRASCRERVSPYV